MGSSIAVRYKKAHLLTQLLVDAGIAARAIQSLLEEGEENRNNNSNFHSLAKDHEKDWNGEDTDSHVVIARANNGE
jgi:hypothetical protein